MTIQCRGDVHGSAVFLRDRSRQGSANFFQRAFECRYFLGHLLRLADEAIRAAFSLHESWILLIALIKRRKAGVANGMTRLAQGRINPHPLIKDKAIAVVMLAAAFFEVFQNPAIELVDFFEALHLHEGSGFLAANSARAKHHDRLVFQLFGQLTNGIGKFPEGADLRIERAFEGAELDLIIIARVEQGHRPAFVEPTLELLRCKLGRGVGSRTNPFDAERDDLFLDPHQHAVEGLMIAVAHLWREFFQTWNRTQSCEQAIDHFLITGDEKVDSLGAEQNRAFQIPGLAAGLKLFPQILEPAQLGKAVGRNVGDHRHAGKTARRG